jgi:hypothetical protein
LAAFDRTGGVTHRYVTYELVSNANSKHDVDLEILPFTKRWPYGDEREYRAVFVSADEDLKAFPGTIELASISPWLAPGLVDAVKETLKSLPQCDGLKVYRSSLIDNKQWQKLAGRVAPTLLCLPPQSQDRICKCANNRCTLKLEARHFLRARQIQTIAGRTT